MPISDLSSGWTVESPVSACAWRMSLGAQSTDTGVQFRVWAPKCQQVDVVLESTGESARLAKNPQGYFSGFVPGVVAGIPYRYRLDDGRSYPDPCSRYQPQGPHGASVIVDPSTYTWHDQNWRGVRMPGQVFYELHIGTFTPEGTYVAAITKLDELVRLGVTVLELMPLAEFPGRWNWGYDGVSLFAPSHRYGHPDELKRLVDEAHSRGLGVILDVVYNHFGPDGNYLPLYSDDYLTDRHPNEWGRAINFDGPGSTEVRSYFIENACYWIAEYHFDGLRLDATHAMHDSSSLHILADISRHAREAAGPRSIILIAECEAQLIEAVHPAGKHRGTDPGTGWELDGIWTDDFHHACRVSLTGRREAYCSDYRGSAQEFISLIKRGFLFQGQRYAWQNHARGTSVTDEPAAAFVFYLQNHDQVANQRGGERLQALASPAKCRALTAVLLLSPETPLLFMGQESGSVRPFLFFADHEAEELRREVYKGRKRFLAQFPSAASPDAQASILDPGHASAFEQSILDWTRGPRETAWFQLHQDLLRLRRSDPVIARQARDRIDGAVLGEQVFVIRYFGDEEGDRLLVVNLGKDFDCVPAPEPLLAPRAGAGWTFIWSSDHPRYGGPGVLNPLTSKGWNIPGTSAVLFTSEAK